MSTNIESASARIPAPADVIFEILADPSQHSRIDGSGTVKAATAGPERLSLGAQFGMQMKQVAPYKITSTVVEFEEGSRIAWRHPMGHTWRYVLEPVEGATLVTESFDYSTLGPAKVALFKLMGFPKRNRSGIEKTLVRLAEVVRADATGGSGE